MIFCAISRLMAMRASLTLTMMLPPVAAITVTDKKELKEKLKEALFLENIRKKAIDNAKVLANRNHNCEQVAREIEEIIGKGC